MAVPGAEPAARRVRLALGVAGAVLMVVGWLVGLAAAADVVRPAGRSSSCRCEAASVHYKAYKGVQAGLARLPWIAASSLSTGLVGHLFYYDGLNAWRQKQLPRVRIYTGGQSPDGRVSMKILWELRHGSALILRVRGNGSMVAVRSSRSFRRWSRSSPSSLPSSSCQHQDAGA